jgi:hypothetical protein
VNGFEAKWENPGGSGQAHQCTFDQAARSYRCQAIKVHPTGGYGGHLACTSWNTGSDYYEYPPGAECTTRENETGLYKDDDPNTDDSYCINGCAFSPVLVIPEGYLYWEPTGGTCTVGDSPAPILDTDGDGTPDDQDAFPDDPNEDTDTDGDGIGDNADTLDDDPTDGADDGEGDESDNTASGGGTCEAQPSCSGDGIQCNQLFQQWRIRCATEGKLSAATGGGGNCDTPLTCTGDPIQCALLRESRAARCSAGEGEDYESVPTTGAEGATPGDTDVLRDRTIGLDDLDDSGWLAKTCPPIPTFSLGSLGSYTPDIPGWCDLLDAVSALIMLIAALISLRILIG